MALTLAEHPGPSITMAQIAARLRVAKPTLYKLAGSKAELLAACLDAEAERLLDHLREATSATELLAALDRYRADSPGGFGLLLERPATGADVRVRRAEAWLADVLGRPPAIAAALLHACARIVVAERREGRPVDAALLAGQLRAAL